MLISRLVSYILGYLVIVMEGEQLEKFINLAGSRQIDLWDLRPTGEGKMVCKLRLEDVYPLRHLARKSKTHFYIKEKKGLPFIFARLRRRKGLVVGGTLFVFALYLLSSFIWTVDVSGNVAVKTEEILQLAGDTGISRGALKWSADLEKTEEHILQQFHAVSWVGVRIKGTHATIEIVEKKIPDEEPTGPSNIVAKKAGLVKEVLVLSGQPVANEGDTVETGQILISGKILPPEEPDAPDSPEEDEEPVVDETEIVYVRARGIVRARVWYEGYGEEELVEEGFQDSGKSISRVCIKLGGKEIILKGPELIPYDKYESEVTVKSIPSWRNLSVPVELITEKHSEVVPFKNVHRRKEAKELAIQKALDDLRKSIPPKAMVLHKRIENIATGRQENVVRIKITVETLEEIGQEKSFKPKKEETTNIDG